MDIRRLLLTALLVLGTLPAFAAVKIKDSDIAIGTIDANKFNFVPIISTPALQGANVQFFVSSGTVGTGGLTLLGPITMTGQLTTTSSMTADGGFYGNLTGDVTGGTVTAHIISRGPIVDVRAFGATGDGVTDDSNAIDAAIASLGTSSGGVVYFPVGEYRQSRPITLTDRDNFTFKGQGRNTKLHAYGFNGRNFDFTDCNGTVIEDMQMMGDGINSANSVGGLIFRRLNNDNTSHTVLRNLYITDITNTGVSMSVPILTTIENVKVRYTTGHGFYMNGGTSININTSYAITTVQAGFRFDDVTYSNINASVAEVNGVGFDFNNSKAITLNGCGTEAMLVRSPTYPGYAYRVDGRAITCVGCYARDSDGGDINEVNGGRLDRINFVHWDTSVTETVLAGIVEMSSGVVVGVDTLVAKEGKVGIGIAPDDLLHIHNVAGLNTSVKIDASSGKNSSLRLYEDADYGFELLYEGASDSLNLWSRKFTGLEANRMTWLKSGYVGINTSTPKSHLEVNGNLGLKTYTETKSSAAVSTTYDVSWSSGSVYWLSLNDNTTLTFSSAVEGQSLTFFIKQNVGSKAITWPTISWPSATAPTLTTTAGKLDIITVVYTGGVYYGFLRGQNY